MDRFLKAKHWQLFFLLVGIPLLFQIFVMSQIFSSVVNESAESVEHVISVFTFFPIIMLIVVSVFYGWLWSLSIGIGAKLPDELKLNTKWFRICFIFLVSYISLIILVIFFTINNIGNVSALDENPAIFLFIIPMHMISIACSIYLLYFSAKTIKTAELKRKLKFSDFAGEFFLIWFFFIGVWVIQPKVNRMVKVEEEMV